MFIIRAAALLALAFFTHSSHAHSGGLDAHGCHAGALARHCHVASAKVDRSPVERVCVYHYVRGDGRYAYIGISNNPERRWREHQRKGRAFTLFAAQIHACYNTRDEALSVERGLIERYCRPHGLHNKKHCLRQWTMDNGDWSIRSL